MSTSIDYTPLHIDIDEHFLGEEPEVQALLNVFAVFKKYSLTLRSFLESITNCKDARIKHHVGMFYSNGDPAVIAKLWIAKWPKDPKLVSVTTSHVVLTARKEISKLAKDKQLRFTRSGFSALNIDDFSLAHINQCLGFNAPLIFKILQGFTSIKTNGSRQQSMALPVIGSILAFSHSRSSNYLQLMMGLYLYSAGCTHKVIDTLHGAGLCVSFPTVNRLLENLTKDAQKEVKLAAKQDPFLLV
ncbi:hypothetical protein BGZ74_005498, partial [Mortierella antarctica]